MNSPAKEDAALVQKQCIMALAAIEDTIYAIGGKWKLKIVIALQAHGRMRFNELQRTVTGISARVLSGELKDLELNGFIGRHVYFGSPVIVIYELTTYSESLNDVLRSMVEWGSQHRNKIRNEIKNKRSE